MFALGRLWRWWTESWRAPRRGRWLYIFMALGFGGLAVVAGVSGDGAVAALAGVASVVTLALVLLAPQLSKWMNPPVE